LVISTIDVYALIAEPPASHRRCVTVESLVVGWAVLP
jgi:hypothetical protein